MFRLLDVLRMLNMFRMLDVFRCLTCSGCLTCSDAWRALVAWRVRMLGVLRAACPDAYLLRMLDVLFRSIVLSFRQENFHPRNDIIRISKMRIHPFQIFKRDTVLSCNFPQRIPFYNNMDFHLKNSPFRQSIV